ncbi:MAG TPA: DUF262 domain-containing protein [Corynebacteriales bacterium]|nr:DUF262 domain-containing protein [Mycobacteriales bacterium]
MEIKLKEVKIKDLVENYQDKADEGVTGYGGRLDIRPPFQREFVYNDKQREAVIDTVSKGFPLNVMYWAVRDNGDFEIIDGQQRTISICQFVNSDFSYKDRYFHNLSDDEQDKILDYELTVYECSGTDSEKLEWFKTINIAGEELTSQELRNAVYHGSWVTDAKRYFSKNSCPAYKIGGRYLNGSAIRQDYLETVIKWVSKNKIEDFMGRNQHKDNAQDLWVYFTNVIEWVESVFPKYRREMKGLPWGELYNQYKDTKLDSDKLEKKIIKLFKDDDVTNNKGIYLYLLTGKKRYLNIRTFDNRQKRKAYTEQKGTCPICKGKFKIEEMEADHITPWHLGGKTIQENCQMLCKECNRRKSNK